MARRKKTLVVVDVQPDFWYERTDHQLSECIKVVKLAAERGWPVVFLEWDECGDTFDKLRQAALGTRAYTYVKCECDGSKQVENAVFLYDLPKNFVVCGMYTEQCVISTVKGLHVRFPKAPLTLAWDACYTGGAIGEKGKMQAAEPAEFHSQFKHEMKHVKKPEKIVKIVGTEELS